MGSPLERPLPVLVGAFAVARLTRLVTEDEITAPLRQRITDWADEVGDATSVSVHYFLTCPWCVSIWTAAGWAGLAIIAPGPAAALGAALAWSQITGLLAELT